MKKILFIIFISLLFIPNVNAAQGLINQNYYASPLTSSSEAQFYNGAGSSLETKLNYVNGSNSAVYFYTDNASYENILSFNTNKTLATNNLYALTVFIDHENDVSFGNIYMKLGQGVWIGGSVNGFINGNSGSNVCQSEIYSYTHTYNWTYSLIVGIDGLGNPNVATQTGMMYIVFKTNCHHPYLAFNVNFESNPGQVRFYGFNLEHLGSADNVTPSQVQSIVDNASNDLSFDIETAEENIKSQIEDSTDKINNTITSEEGPTNIGALNNSAGWLPAGPIDSILNLPLSLFNSLLNALSSTCQPLNLNFPFVNFNYQLPCVSTLYSKINGAGAVIDFVGIVIGILVLYYYFIHLYNWVDAKLTMQYNDEWGGI